MKCYRRPESEAMKIMRKNVNRKTKAWAFHYVLRFTPHPCASPPIPFPTACLQQLSSLNQRQNKLQNQAATSQRVQLRRTTQWPCAVLDCRPRQTHRAIPAQHRACRSWRRLASVRSRRSRARRIARKSRLCGRQIARRTEHLRTKSPSSSSGPCKRSTRRTTFSQAR